MPDWIPLFSSGAQVPPLSLLNSKSCLASLHTSVSVLKFLIYHHLIITLFLTHIILFSSCKIQLHPFSLLGKCWLLKSFCLSSLGKIEMTRVCLQGLDSIPLMKSLSLSILLQRSSMGAFVVQKSLKLILTDVSPGSFRVCTLCFCPFYCFFFSFHWDMAPSQNKSMLFYFICLFFTWLVTFKILQKCLSSFSVFSVFRM